MQYSIVIPVFNKAALTRHCLQTLRPTLEGAGDGEIIVIDNASSDETPELLREFSWVRVVRNETNRGFAGANNQGAALARGKYLVLLNNDTEARPRWLASMLAVAEQGDVGAVGARLLFPDGTLQHAGVAIEALPFGSAGFLAFHELYRRPGNDRDAAGQRDLQVVTGACLVTARALYEELGGLDEGFWNGYEDIDYCLKVRKRGLRVVYDGNAVLTHFESQSGPQRFRRVGWNVGRLAQRWNGAVTYDAQANEIARGCIRRHERTPHGAYTVQLAAIPRTQIICHGEASSERKGALERMLRDSCSPVESIDFVPPSEAIAFARAAMEVRGDRYLALIDARCDLQPGWLDELVRQIEFSPNTGAAAFLPECELSEDRPLLASDGRCTLIALRKFSQHLRLDDAFPTLGGAVADFLIRGIGGGARTRSAGKNIGTAPASTEDAVFADRHGMALQQIFSDELALVEDVLRKREGRRRGLVSIVMLSWNAPQFTKLALESIRRHTQGEYEIIIVDNGSRSDTVEWLRTLEDVRVIYNPSNRGYAGGNNQAMAAARGEYVVLLNNDVVVTEGWLDGLLAAFDRVPALGVSAPRSNKIAGDQITLDSEYETLEAMQEYACERRRRFAGEGYMTDRAIGLCLCIDRRVIEEIGGIDERFGVGNFEDDDFCIRVRAAGYRIYVCDDVFIHHFGSQTFAANKVDWTSTMRENWRTFAKKWGYPEQYQESYVPAHAIRGGFDRARHFVPLPVPEDEAVQPDELRQWPLAFAAHVRDERDWNDVGAFVRRYLQAFDASDGTLLAIAASGLLDANTIGSRVQRLVERLGLDANTCADVDVVDSTGGEAWIASLAAPQVIRIEELAQRSPSALRRMLPLEKTG